MKPRADELLRVTGALSAAAAMAGAVGLIISAPGATDLEVIGGLVAFAAVWWLAAGSDADDDLI